MKVSLSTTLVVVAVLLVQFVAFGATAESHSEIETALPAGNISSTVVAAALQECVQKNVITAQQSIQIAEAISRTVLNESVLHVVEEEGVLFRFFTAVRQTVTLLNVLYFGGAMIIIGAMTVFMTLGLERFGGLGIFALAMAYMVGLMGIGTSLWRSSPDFGVLAGLLNTAGVSITPLAVHGLRRYFNWWTRRETVPAYNRIYEAVSATYCWDELATVLVGCFSLWLVPFPFTTMPIAVALGLFALDVMPILNGTPMVDAQTNLKYYSLFGFNMLLLAYNIDLRTKRTLEPLQDDNIPQMGSDFSFWIYLVGSLLFWNGLSWQKPSGPFGMHVYIAINAVLLYSGLQLGTDVCLLRDDRLVLRVLGAVGVVMAHVRASVDTSRTRAFSWGGGGSTLWWLHVRLVITLVVLLIGTAYRGSVISILVASFGILTHAFGLANSPSAVEPVCALWFSLCAGILFDNGVFHTTELLPALDGADIFHVAAAVGVVACHASLLAELLSPLLPRVSHVLFINYRKVVPIVVALIGGAADPERYPWAYLLVWGSLPALLIIAVNHLHRARSRFAAHNTEAVAVWAAAALCAYATLIVMIAAFVGSASAVGVAEVSKTALGHGVAAVGLRSHLYFTSMCWHVVGSGLFLALLLTCLHRLRPWICVYVCILAIVVDSSLLVTLGGVSLFLYLMFEAHVTFKNSLWFPLVLSGLGLVLMASGYGYQRHREALHQGVAAVMPLSRIGDSVLGLARRASEQVGRHAWPQRYVPLWTSLIKGNTTAVNGHIQESLEVLMAAREVMPDVAGRAMFGWVIAAGGVLALCSAASFLLRFEDFTTSPALRPQRLSFEFSPNTRYGAVVHMSASKPADLTFKQAYLYVGGTSAFWTSASRAAGSVTMRLFLAVFHPVKLCPTILDPSVFVDGSSTVVARFEIGTAVRGGFKLGKGCMKRTLEKLRDDGDIPFTLCIMYGRGWLRARRILFRADVKPSQLLAGTDSSVDLIATVNYNAVIEDQHDHQQ